MSLAEIAIAAYHSRAKGTAKLVLLAIADHSTDAGAYPSVRTLTRWANVADRNVRKALRELEELGEIRTILHGAPDHRVPEWRRHNVYEFLLTCPPTCDGSGRHRDIQARRTEALTITSAGVLLPPDASVPTPGDNPGVLLTPPDASVPTPLTPASPLKHLTKQPPRLRKETQVIAREPKLSAICGHEAFLDAHSEPRCYLACRTEYQMRQAVSA